MQSTKLIMKSIIPCLTSFLFICVQLPELLYFNFNVLIITFRNRLQKNQWTDFLPGDTTRHACSPPATPVRHPPRLLIARPASSLPATPAHHPPRPEQVSSPLQVLKSRAPCCPCSGNILFQWLMCFF